MTVVHALVEHVFLPFGSSAEIVSDQGTEFCNTLLSELCQRLHIARLRTTAYRPLMEQLSWYTVPSMNL